MLRDSSAEVGNSTFDDWSRAMSAGNFLRAWQINDHTGNHWPSAHRLWVLRDAQPATLIVNSLHGLGDAVQMLRYAPQLQKLAAHICFHVPKVLGSLIPHFRGVEHYHSDHRADHHKPCQSGEIEMMELPYLFRTKAEELPLGINYLDLPSSVLKESLSRMGSTKKLRIGVVWAGGDWDCERWVPLTLLKAIFCDTRFEWWNLQGASEAQQACDLPLRSLRQLCGEGLVPLSAAIANLDLIITIDSLAAHLAGALGKPAWLMLKHDADWRWMERRSDSPWYPSLRLFRQTSPGNWNSVIVAVMQALERFRLSGMTE